MREAQRQHYATPGQFTSLGSLGATVPAHGDLAGTVGLVQGLVVYDLVAETLYGVELSTQQAEGIHLRDTAELVRLARAIDNRPLDEARPPAQRIGGRCHTFSRLTVALLRTAGVPARARCGFGAYFRPGWFEDHWIAEIWDDGDGRWTMVDAQLDDVWRDVIGFEGDVLDIAPEEFVTAGHAWQAWRRGELDADRCGLSAIDEHGSFWIAGNLRLDLASLNKVEMLPWDLWGEGWEPGEEPTEAQLQLFDEVAALTTDPDQHFDDLRRRYESDEALRMPGSVFNVERGRSETV